MGKTIYILLIITSLFVLQSCEEIIMEDDIANKQVVILAPVNNAMLNNTSATFSWEFVEGATQYQLQIAKPDFNNALQIVLDTIISDNTFTQQLNLGNYQWRVRALNSAYQTAYVTRNITIVSNDDFESNTVTLITPNNGLVTNETSQNLAWQSIIGAIGYQVQVLDANDLLIENQVVSGTSFTYQFPEGSFQWRVRATNGTQQTLYASRNILVDTTNPNTPVLTDPADNSIGTDENISFQWNRTPIAGSLEKDSIYVFTNSGLTNLQFKNQASSPFSSTLPMGTYYWYVKAFDQAGNISNQSSVFSFTVN